MNTRTLSLFGAAALAVAATLFAATQPTQASDQTWMTDYSAAVAKAKAEGKAILLDFTGKDWCGWCIRLDAEVFSTEKFAEYAKENLVLVELDFPRTSEPPQQNIDLMRKYQVQGFPTIVVLSPNEKEIARLGYLPGGPEAWLSELSNQIAN